MEGFINVLKPPGITSHDVVNFVRKKLGIKKVGHGGTLDPGAAGVIPVGVGRATRLLEYITELSKAYRAEMTLGITTTTQDAYGEILSKKAPGFVDPEKMRNLFKSFTGEIAQIPPMASAVRYHGKKLYQIFREGGSVQRPSRIVTIYDLQLVDLKMGQFPRIIFDVVCSKGTYIRTLCADLGEKLGCGAHLSFLVRTRTGPFLLEESWTLEDLEDFIVNKRFDFLAPLDISVKHFPKVQVKPGIDKLVLNGVSIPATKIDGFNHLTSCPSDQLLRVYSANGIFLAIGRWAEGTIKLEKVFG